MCEPVLARRVAHRSLATSRWQERQGCSECSDVALRVEVSWGRETPRRADRDRRGRKVLATNTVVVQREAIIIIIMIYDAKGSPREATRNERTGCGRGRSRRVERLATVDDESLGRSSPGRGFVL